MSVAPVVVTSSTSNTWEWDNEAKSCPRKTCSTVFILSSHRVSGNRYRHHLLNTLGNTFCRIISPLSSSFLRDGHRNHEVNVIEETAFLHTARHHLSDVTPKCRLMILFECLDDIAEFRARFIIEPCRSLFQVLYQSPEVLCHHILVWIELITGNRCVTGTYHAHIFICAGKPLATYHTPPGCNDIHTCPQDIKQFILQLHTLFPEHIP